jgi:hypothetical protein
MHSGTTPLGVVPASGDLKRERDARGEADAVGLSLESHMRVARVAPRATGLSHLASCQSALSGTYLKERHTIVARHIVAEEARPEGSP